MCPAFVTAPIAQPPPILADVNSCNGDDCPTPFEAPESQTSLPRTSRRTGSAALVSLIDAEFLKQRLPSV